MSLASVTVDTTAGGVTIQSGNPQRRGVFLFNNSTTITVYLKFDNSATALTAFNGYPLLPQTGFFIGPEMCGWGLDAAFLIKGITASGTADVRTQEI